MPDLRKVLKAWECCKNPFDRICEKCPFEKECCHDGIPDFVVAKAVDLLKEQEKPNGKCVNECECWDSAYERGKQDALKEQEAVEPKVMESYRLNSGRRSWRKAWCGACGIGINMDSKFCDHCGRKVKWNENI